MKLYEIHELPARFTTSTKPSLANGARCGATVMSPRLREKSSDRHQVEQPA